MAMALRSAPVALPTFVNNDRPDSSEDRLEDGRNLVGVLAVVGA